MVLAGLLVQLAYPALGLAQTEGAKPVDPASDTAAAASVPSQLARRCGEGRWKLDGASSAADEGADYNEAWGETLDRVAQCGQVLSLTSSCLRVRGHYDEVEFSGAVAVVGGPERAQQLRAESRANRVARELRNRGVHADILRDRLLPHDFPTFRGVTIDVAPDCRDSVVDAYATAIARRVVLEQQQAAAQQNAVVEAPAEPPAPRPAPVAKTRSAVDSAWLSLAAGPGLVFVPGSDQQQFIPRALAELRAGIMVKRVYAEARGTLLASLQDESRLGYGFAGSLGYGFRDHHQVGLAVGWRLATHELSGPWLTREWTAGVEGRHCIWGNGASRWCIWEGVEPLGRHVQRAEVIEGQAMRGMPRAQHWAMRVIAGVSYRFEVVQ